jgi:hypothetical protein
MRNAEAMMAIWVGVESGCDIAAVVRWWMGLELDGVVASCISPKHSMALVSYVAFDARDPWSCVCSNGDSALLIQLIGSQPSESSVEYHW